MRNRGTIGGNVAHADPASDLPTVLTALGARFTVSSPDGERSIGAADFFQGMMATALGEQDILTAIHVPASGAGTGTAYVKFSHPASRYAVIGAAAAVTADGRTCTGASVVVGGVTPVPARCAAVERALAGQALSADAIAAAAAAAGSDLGDDLLGDVFASADYRRAVTPVYVQRAITAAAERAG